VEDILLLTLTAYLQYGPKDNHPASSSSLNENKDENGGNASLVVTPSQRMEMADIIESIRLFTSSKYGSSDANNGRFLSMLFSPRVENVIATVKM
jgi:hypothetical protein